MNGSAGTRYMFSKSTSATAPGDGGPTTLLDLKRAALANLALLDGAVNGRPATAFDRKRGARPSYSNINRIRDRSLSVLTLLGDEFPGATDADLDAIAVDFPLYTLNGKKKGRGDLEQLWNQVQPALAKAGDDILQNETVQSVARNNPIMAAARAAFQIAVQENVGGIASMMVGNEKTEAHVRKVWEGLGGKWSNLQRAISKGREKGGAGAIGALPSLWDANAWRNLSALDLMLESLPYGLPPSLFASTRGHAMVNGVDQYGDVEDSPDSGSGKRKKEKGANGGGGGGWLAGVLKAAGPVLDTVLNAYGTKTPADVKAVVDASKDGESERIAKEVLNALLQKGTDIVKDKLDPPAPPRTPAPVAPRWYADRRTRGPVRLTRPPTRRV